MAQVNAVGAHNLWHGRLGHPSNQVLSLIAKDLEISDNVMNKRPCDDCFRAKQTRTPFVESDSHAFELFELIHCVIWADTKFHCFVVPSIFLLLLTMQVVLFGYI